jgi:acetylglutamate kinase
VIVVATGGRECRDYRKVLRALQKLLDEHGTWLVVLHGGAQGADTLVDDACQELGVPRRSFPVGYESVGPERNLRMVKYALTAKAKSEDIICLAFPGGIDTNDCKRQCREHDIRIVHP